MHQYACKACGAPAAFDQGAILRSCGCDHPVVANMIALAQGAGGVVKPQFQPVAATQDDDDVDLDLDLACGLPQPTPVR